MGLFDYIVQSIAQITDFLIKRKEGESFIFFLWDPSKKVSFLELEIYEIARQLGGVIVVRQKNTHVYRFLNRFRNSSGN